MAHGKSGARDQRAALEREFATELLRLAEALRSSPLPEAVMRLRAVKGLAAAAPTQDLLALAADWERPEDGP